jgi:polar amino acid transport system substrate-binding protein
MQKSRVSIALILASILLSACVHQTGKGIKEPAGPVIDRILKRGELVVGTSGNMPPFNMTTRKKDTIGLDVDLSNYMAAAMGVALRLVTMPFFELLPALEAGKVDMVLSGMTITPDRNLRAAFAGPYFVTGKSFLTKRETIAAVKDCSNLNNPLITLAALKDSTSQTFAENAMPRAKLILTNNYDEAVELVLKDKVDALIADYPICVVSTFRYPNQGLISLITPITYEPLGIALPPHDPLLVNWVENILDEFRGNGGLDELKNRWFNDRSWLKELP